MTWMVRKKGSLLGLEKLAFSHHQETWLSLEELDLVQGGTETEDKAGCRCPKKEEESHL